MALLLTVAEVAWLCDVKPGTVRAWIARGRLSRQPCGRIHPSDLVEWWDERRDTRMVDLRNRRSNRVA